MKKPFYKRIWFWVVVAIFVAAGIDNIFHPIEDQSAKTEETSKKTSNKRSKTSVSSDKKGDKHKKDLASKQSAKSSSKKIAEEEASKVLASKKASSKKSGQQANKASSEKSSETAETSSKYAEIESKKSFARYFGNKSEEYLQKRPYAYAKQQVNNEWHYMYKQGDTTYLRIDSSDNNTTVYEYDSENDKVGQLLYQGRTIFYEPAKKSYNFMTGQYD